MYFTPWPSILTNTKQCMFYGWSIFEINIFGEKKGEINKVPEVIVKINIVSMKKAEINNFVVHVF